MWPDRLMIQVTERVREALRGSRFAFEERGEIDVKGKGRMKTFLLGRAPEIRPQDG